MRIVLAVAFAIALIVCGLTCYWPSLAWSERTVSTAAYRGPALVTPEDMRAFNLARAQDKPLPAGWSRIRGAGTVRIVETGGTWKITVQARREDLVSATAYVDGSVVRSATRENGGIVDLGDDAIATRVVPETPWTFAGKVEWIGSDGSVSSSGRELPGFVLRMKEWSNAVFERLTR